MEKLLDSLVLSDLGYHNLDQLSQKLANLLDDSACNGCNEAEHFVKRHLADESFDPILQCLDRIFGYFD